MSETPLRRWRTSRGLTLDDVAGLTGFSAAQISRIERGRSNPGPLSKVSIARSLRVPVHAVFEVERHEMTAA